MKGLLVILWMFCSLGISSQQIVQAEYFFDVDPGLGLGTPISITTNQDISDLLVSIDASGISNGIHNLIVRAQDDNGSWSLSHQQTFLKTDLPSSSPIVELEYYFDNDPGVGNGNSITITPNTDIANHLSSISTSGISEGIHNLSVRSKNDEGIWSHVQTISVLISPPISTKNIVALEYFVGEDPGFGNGSSISISAGNNLPNQSMVVPINDLDFGVNRISIRGMDESGSWSHTTINSILKMEAPNIPNIVEIEYFFDVDPGFGNGTFVSFGPGPNWSDLSVLVSTTSIPDGLHVLYIRSKDSNGVWSMTNSTVIQKTTVVELSDISAMEYFFDVDPGFGACTAISISSSTDIGNKVATISVSGLSKGIHKLFLRTMNTLGEWSLSHTKTILITNPKIERDIVAMEYYFDTDPGYGMGDSIAVTDMPDISDLNSLISVVGLSNGVHNLFVRSRDSKGKWTHSHHKAFLLRAPDVEENIQKMEYFIGDDPGFGNGIDITVPSITGVPDIIDLQHMIDINSLDAGVQRLNIRSQDDQGVWTHTLIHPIYVYKNVNGNMVKAEYFIDTDPGYGLANEITFSPTLDKNDHVFPLDVSGLDYGIYRLHVRYMSENNKWTQDEITPFYYKDGQLYEVVEGEYFIDEDPGLGLATPFSFTPDVDVADISILILTGDLDAGEHDLYIRTKNANGEWSLTNVKFDIEIESTLPLNILSFEATKKGREVLLKWTASEAVNTSHFEIERSQNSVFEYLGTVESINEIGEVDYQYIDTDPFEGWNYYRLKQFDLDGTFKYSAIRSIYFGRENSIVVYPNPTINEISIDGKIEGGTTFLIYDSSSKLVKRGAASANTSIDMSQLIPGSYHLILQSDSINKSYLIIKI